MKVLFVLLMASISIPVIAQHTATEKTIAKVLYTQQDAWNRGDLEAFMEPYWHNDSLMYVGSSGPTYGWQPTLDNYKRNYDSPAKMGTLHFTLIRFKPLGKKHYQVVGRWALARTAGDVSGYFTLVFEKINGEWVIIFDHSS